MTKSSELKEKEVDELYAIGFRLLHLFPDFVKDFNSLLREKNELTTLTGKRTSWLHLCVSSYYPSGIDDSSKIAEFLHYSVNTKFTTIALK